MLIDRAIEAAKASEALIPARPVVAWAVEARTFLMCRPLHESLMAGRQSTDERAIRRWAQLDADISHFIEGGYVTEELFKRLDPPTYEHWELRSPRPRPSLRVFGRFAKPDVFVGTHAVVRASMGPKWSARWEHEKLVCEDHWREAGLPEPFRGARYEDYITANAAPRLRISK